MNECFGLEYGSEQSGVKQPFFLVIFRAATQNCVDGNMGVVIDWMEEWVIGGNDRENLGGNKTTTAGENLTQSAAKMWGMESILRREMTEWTKTSKFMA